MTEEGDGLRRALDERDIVHRADRERIDELIRARHQDTLVVGRLTTELDAERRRSATLADQLALVADSSTWRLAVRSRETLWRLLGGRGSLPAQAARAVVRGIRGRRARAAGEAVPTPPAPAPSLGVAPEPPIVRFPPFGNPVVSLIVPVFSQPGLTLACLRSISDHLSGASYEVIVVDDQAHDDVRAALGAVAGARLVTNETNQGYLRSINRGAAVARGKWLVVCNNDIEFYDGWLEAMLDCAESDPAIGVVTPRYVYPDGLLSEAGAIVWRDGSASNYGRYHRSDIFHFLHRRDVDYGSGAALMVRASLWREIGGYDERYVPIYYEDVDLCFQARARGYRVVYEPEAIVMHIEGGTSGTDVAAGLKRHQEDNRVTFVAKWRESLDAGQQDFSPHAIRDAADRNRGPRVLVIVPQIPRWNHDAGSARMKAIIDSLLSHGRRVVLLPDDRQQLDPYSRELGKMGVEVWYGDAVVDAELRAVHPSLEMVLSSRPTPTARWLDLVRECAPGVPVLYDTVDLHWLRELRRHSTGTAAASSSDGLTHGTRAHALHELETAMMRASDATLAVSGAERDRIRREVPASRIWVAPTVNAIREPVAPREGRAGIVFVGGFEHAPNLDATLRLIRQVMPLVWETVPDVHVSIVGSSPPDEVLALASPRVEILGWVPEVEPILDRSLAMVAPLSYGAGLKGKITQALATGLPVVTTPVGAEGLDAIDGSEVLIAVDDAGLARHVVSVLVEPERWSVVSQAGHDLARRQFSLEVLERIVGDIIDGLPQLRESLNANR